MADHPLRPATDRRLGRPLPYQLANQTSAAQVTRGPKVPRFPPQSLCGISTTFAALSPITWHVPTHYSPVRHSPPGASSRAAVRLACVKHAASVQSEPGSNSSVQSLTNFVHFGTQGSKKPEGFSVSCSASVWLRPGTHTYRLFVLLKTSAAVLLQRRRRTIRPDPTSVNRLFRKTPYTFDLFQQALVL